MGNNMLKIQWIGFITIIRKETSRIFRIWTQTLLPSVITTTLYFLIFGNFIGSRIGKLENFSYIEFIVPGIILMTVITNSYTNVVSTFFSAKFQKNIEELLVSPISNSVILLGYMFGGIIRGILVGILVTIVSLFFSPITFLHPVLIVITVIFTSVLFSLCGLLNAIFSKTFDDITIIPTFVITPLIYLGGVFYSIKMLPTFWQKVSLFNPILYLVNIFRYGFLGISDISITISLLFLAGFIVVMWGICLTLLNRGVGIKQ